MPTISESLITQNENDELDDDAWLQKSLRRMENSDPDFEVTSEEVNNMILTVPKAFDFKRDRSFLVYESQLEKLLNRCLKCNGPVIGKNECKGDGSQYRVHMECLNGCKTAWNSQPLIAGVAGKNIVQ